jgi:hypothetical protein
MIAGYSLGEGGFSSAVPAGLDVFLFVPALKCRAIFVGSFGTERQKKLRRPGEELFG